MQFGHNSPSYLNTERSQNSPIISPLQHQIPCSTNSSHNSQYSHQPLLLNYLPTKVLKINRSHIYNLPTKVHTISKLTSTTSYQANLISLPNLTFIIYQPKQTMQPKLIFQTYQIKFTKLQKPKFTNVPKLTII